MTCVSVAPARSRPRAVPVVLPPPAWVTTTCVGYAPVSDSISRAISRPRVSMPLTPKLL